MSKLLVFASSNAHKSHEIKQLLGKEWELKNLNDLHFHEEIVEDADTFEGNALIKAETIFKRFGTNCFADDSGLVIPALHGAPGVLSARYAGPEKDDQKNLLKVLRDMEQLEDRRAYFITCIALVMDGEVNYFEGKVEGHIRRDTIGTHGFGYDPIFEPELCGKTFAEMDTEEKNRYSHRARAMKAFLSYLNEVH
ncbi:MAG: RdgB/HAM1 family non-canonical purine NTP pyrophosphatase [Bacteroidetes bacterium]|nr:MAG: RdgB/HAM1 family non-canonical purine NTP pyrophosphatase [Bacteroidota bacterium]